MYRRDTLPKVEDLVKGRVYKIRSRNLSHGVWDGNDSFIGIRQKFGDRFLFPEVHWDACDTYGTVIDAEDTGINVPDNMELKCSNDDLFKFLDKIKPV